MGQFLLLLQPLSGKPQNLPAKMAMVVVAIVEWVKSTVIMQVVIKRFAETNNGKVSFRRNPQFPDEVAGKRFGRYMQAGRYFINSCPVLRIPLVV